MIKAEFYQKDNSLIGFSITGHAMFADFGEDIVCAGVSSAVMLVANGITEVIRCKAEIEVDNNLVKLILSENSISAEYFINALNIHLKNLIEDYPNTIEITYLEV